MFFSSWKPAIFSDTFKKKIALKFCKLKRVYIRKQKQFECKINLNFKHTAFCRLNLNVWGSMLIFIYYAMLFVCKNSNFKRKHHTYTYDSKDFFCWYLLKALNKTTRRMSEETNEKKNLVKLNEKEKREK